MCSGYVDIKTKAPPKSSERASFNVHWYQQYQCVISQCVKYRLTMSAIHWKSEILLKNSRCTVYMLNQILYDKTVDVGKLSWLYNLSTNFHIVEYCWLPKAYLFVCFWVFSVLTLKDKDKSVESLRQKITDWNILAIYYVYWEIFL